MATKNYGLTGVGSNVQFGKGGARIESTQNDDFSLYRGDGVTLAPVSIGAPTAAEHAVNLSYVEGLVQGLQIKESVFLATSSASDLTGLTYDAGNDVWTGATTAPTFDGVSSYATGTRLLIKDAVDTRGNGIWTYEDATDTLVRADDANNLPNNEVRVGMFCFITGGNTLSSTGWVLSSTDSATSVITLGTDTIVFTQFSSAGVANAGDGLTKTGNTFDVNVDGGTIDINGSNALIVSSSANAGQVLVSTGTAGQAAVWGVYDIVNDTTPQLGGHLDVNGSSIVSTSNANINITPNGTGKVVLSGLEFPNTDGTAGQVVTTDGNGVLTFQDASSSELVDDTTPQLGGDLDVNGFAITSVSGGDIIIAPDTTGNLTLVVDSGNVDISSVTGSVVISGLVFPALDGTAGQALVTDGFGQLSFADVIGAVVDDTAPELGGNLDVGSNFITTTTVNGDIVLLPNGTGVISVTGTTDYETNVTDDDDIPNKKYVDDSVAVAIAQAVDPVRRQAVTADSTNSSFNIGAALPTPSSGAIYVTCVKLHVTTSFSGGSVDRAQITDGTNVLMTFDENDIVISGTYVAELPLAVTSDSSQVVIEFFEADGTTPAIPTAGAAIVSLEYVNY